MRLIPALSEREERVLELIAKGKSDKQIATVLCSSVNTVHNHVSHILQKLGVANRVEAACQYTLCKPGGGGRQNAIVKNNYIHQ
jgi:DNA-binding NarL/FixJ family response regulator